VGLQEGMGFQDAEPSIFALIGSTAVLAGSGQIRLFFATVMLEITGQLQLVPFVALAAMVATFTASMFSDHGLYHALIHQMGLPYLPLERGSDKDHEHAAHGGQRRSALDLCCRWLFSECWCYRTWTAPKKDPVLVKEVMATPVACVERGQTKSDIQSCLKDESHNAFPVICSDGKLHGLLLKAELEDKHFEPETKVEKIADVAPACIGDEWPLERAHHLFTALGLRHLLVIDRDGRPVGMLTRHDLQEHGHEHAHETSRCIVEPLPPAPDGSNTINASAPTPAPMVVLQQSISIGVQSVRMIGPGNVDLQSQLDEAEAKVIEAEAKVVALKKRMAESRSLTSPESSRGPLTTSTSMPEQVAVSRTNSCRGTTSTSLTSAEQDDASTPRSWIGPSSSGQ